LAIAQRHKGYCIR